MRRTRRPLGTFIALVAIAAAATPAFGWGHTGHAIINRLAVDALPDGPLKAFFKKRRDWIGDHAVDPDEYKKKHHAEEGPKHFLNIDEGGQKAEDYPKTWKAVVEKFGLHTALKQGKVPWAIEDTFQELVQAFKAKDGTKIIEKATWLGHYVGDAHQPFHACANFNGQLTGQKGIHSIFESNMIDHHADEVEKEAAKLVASQKVAEIQGEIGAWGLKCVIASDKLAHEILQADKGTRSSSREKALWTGTGAIAEKRIADAAVGLASLWLTAWTKAGKPELPSQLKLPEGESPSGGSGGDDSERDSGMDKPADPPPAKPEEPPAKADAPPAKNTSAVPSPIDGLTVRDDETQPGAVISLVAPSSNVAAAGIASGDIIIAVDGAPVNSVATLSKRCHELKSGANVPFTILRDGAEHTFSVTIP
jgi:hypothetical protein